MTIAFFVSYCLLWIIVIAQVAVILYLARQLGLLYIKVGPAGARMMNVGPKLNEQIAPTYLSDIRGRGLVLGAAGDRNTLLLFLSPSCSTCVEIAKSLPAIARPERQSLLLVVTSRASLEENEPLFERLSLDNVFCVIGDQLWDAFHVALSPYALLIDTTGRLAAKGLVNNLAHLESILNAEELKAASVQAAMARGDVYEVSRRTIA